MSHNYEIALPRQTASSCAKDSTVCFRTKIVTTIMMGLLKVESTDSAVRNVAG